MFRWLRGRWRRRWRPLLDETTLDALEEMAKDRQEGKEEKVVIIKTQAEAERLLGRIDMHKVRR